jgi:hypothetical protein
MTTQPTSYKFDNNLEDEIAYLRFQIQQVYKLPGYDRRFPPSLVDKVEAGRRCRNRQLD